MTITPHFWDSGATTDPQNLASSMVDGLLTIAPTTAEVRCAVYDAQGTKPVYPAALEIRNPGGMQATTNPRELAMCLSFYGDRNVKRQRGRLYIPPFVLSMSTNSLRPSIAQTGMQALVDLFTGLGGVDVDWCVYSRLLDRAFSVTNYWWDDEWDVVRSRGLKGTTRQEGSTNEGLKETTTSLLAA